MAGKRFRFIVLTGPPGCGKTTLIKKVCNALKQKNFTFDGFFTEEVRSEKERTGFDIVLMNGTKAPLARVESVRSKEPCIGKYSVKVNSFESCILPILNTQEKKSILVLDEIGKMELLSDKFREFVIKYFNSKNNIILATVPIKTGKPIPVVEMVKTHPHTILINVNRKNRDGLVDKVTNLVIHANKYCII